MKVNQIINQIDEAKFDTQLTNLTSWHNKTTDPRVHLRTGWLGEFEMVVTVKFIKSGEFNITGVATEFGIRTREMATRNEDFEYDIGKFPDAPATQIFGAVVNVLRGDLPAHWDFMYAIAKDHIAGRIKLYAALFHRFAPTYSMVVDSVHQQGYESGVIMARQQDMEAVKTMATRFFQLGQRQ